MKVNSALSVHNKFIVSLVQPRLNATVKDGLVTMPFNVFNPRNDIGLDSTS